MIPGHSANSFNLRLKINFREIAHQLSLYELETLMKVSCLVAFLLAAPSSAQAFCSQGFGVDFAQKVSGYIDYLICLHNEQTDTLNEHARLINQHADLLNELNDGGRKQWDALQGLSSALDDLVQENRRTMKRNEELESELENLTRRLDELNYRITQLE
ncbi:MAG: hypothetical protein JNK19_06595 [Tabrizicola sp.]|nr:hypothetical protein [Tabrizicola sp.]